jgi:hypothetical protein
MRTEKIINDPLPHLHDSSSSSVITGCLSTLASSSSELTHLVRLT